ncbi:DNA-binding transcriptional LysR family regulator [Bradyrhizobium sp. i1.7.7]
MQLFARVARSGSFSVAGREMGISQPTTSRIVAALEKQIGVALLVRTTRAVTLTEAGSDYLSRIESILSALEEADHAARGNGELRGILRVASSSAFARIGVLPRLARFTDLHPGLRVEFFINDDRKDLVGESVDVALRIGVLNDSTAVARKIGTAHRVVVATPAYLARAGTPSVPSDLADHTIIIGPARPRPGGVDVSTRRKGQHGTRRGTVYPERLGRCRRGRSRRTWHSLDRRSQRDERIGIGPTGARTPRWGDGIGGYQHRPSGGPCAAKPSARAFADFMEAEFRQLQAAKNRGERIAN